MKKVLRPVYAGINGKLNKDTGKYEFEVDFDNNTEDDVVKFIEPYFQKSEIDTNTYWFGYAFNDGQSNPRRDEFIEFIKTVQLEKFVDPYDEWSGFDYDDEHITETDLNNMIANSLSRIHLDKYSVDAIVYPESKSGNLVKMIVKCIVRFLGNNKEISANELKKADPASVQFDYTRFEKDVEDNKVDLPDFIDTNYIKNMMRRAQEAPTFSLRKYIKPTVLRNYVTNFYKIAKNNDLIESAETVLVVDDFGTTGTTIREIIRNIREINPTCEVYIFTLMGNRRKK